MGLLHLCKPYHSALTGTSPPISIMKQFNLQGITRGCDNFSTLAAATVLYNLLDLPAGCLPVTRVDPSKDEITEEWKKGPGHGSPLLEAGVYTAKNALYNPVATAGMPVSIQIVGRKWGEEKVLAMMGVVDEALGKNRGFGPGNWHERANK